MVENAGVDQAKTRRFEILYIYGYAHIFSLKSLPARLMRVTLVRKIFFGKKGFHAAWSGGATFIQAPQKAVLLLAEGGCSLPCATATKSFGLGPLDRL